MQQYEVANFVSTMREYIIQNGTARQLADFDNKFTNVDFSSVKDIAQAKMLCQLADNMKKSDNDVSTSTAFVIGMCILGSIFFAVYGFMDVVFGGNVYENITAMYNAIF